MGRICLSVSFFSVVYDQMVTEIVVAAALFAVMCGRVKEALVLQRQQREKVKGQ